MNNDYHYVCLMLSIVLMSGVILQINAEQYQIPNWIRNNAKWWYHGQIQDTEFINGIQYLIENKIIIIQSSSVKLNKENKIPIWVKNNAGLWSNGTISDNDFISGMQYLIDSGIILINSDLKFNQNNLNDRCDKMTTPAEKETCIEQLEYNAKIKNSMKTITPNLVGPVAFYYVNSKLQKVDDGKTILTIHFIVQNIGNQEITMTCQRPNSCNYILSDGRNEIPYATNTLVYGSMTLAPNIPRYIDWTFYSTIDSSKNYSFLIKEPWGSSSIPVKIS